MLPLLEYFTCRVETPQEVALAGLVRNKTKAVDVIDIPPKGRGVVAAEGILKGEFVLEYKYDLSYPRQERRVWEEEYTINGEGSYILEAQLPDGKWVCFDATRAMGTVGRLVNHSPRPNLKLHKPLRVRGKWRMALLAVRDIDPGEEVMFDYGKQPSPPDWMRGRKVRSYASKIKTWAPPIIG